MSSWAGKFHGKRACFYVNFKKKKKKKVAPSTLPFFVLSIAVGTLTVLLLPDDIKTLVTHFDQSD